MKSSTTPRIGDPWYADGPSKDAFWSVVVACLKEFLALDPAQARNKADSLRSAVETPPEGISGELIYHNEPFYVACDLAGVHGPRDQDDLLERNRARYHALLEHYAW
jgi:hypothetical protein